jgi:hypothetical protein
MEKQLVAYIVWLHGVLQMYCWSEAEVVAFRESYMSSIAAYQSFYGEK